MRAFGECRRVREFLVVLGLAALVGCGSTEPEPESGQAINQIVIPPIQNYTFSAIINPGCQDTGYGINDAGTTIGISSCPGMGAFRKAADGTVTILPALSSQGTNGTAVPLDINGAGRMVGYSVETGTGNSSRPVQWFSVKGIMSVNQLGALPGGSSGQAYAVNANNDIVGWSEIAMAGGVIRKHGFLRRTSGLLVDLVPANCYLNAEAYDLNDQSFVVGVSYTPITGSGCAGVPSRQATLWKPAGSGSNTFIRLPSWHSTRVRPARSTLRATSLAITGPPRPVGTPISPSGR